MAKSIVPKSSSSKIAIAIFVLLVLSVVLLVFLLRGQLHHEESSESNSHLSSKDAKVVASKTTTPKKSVVRPFQTTVTPQPDVQSDHTSLSSLLPDDEHPWLDFRLPPYIRPLHYDLLLRPDLSGDVFSGNVNITVNVTRDTKYFVVHAYRLSVRVTGLLDPVRHRTVKVEKSFFYAPHEYFVVQAEDTVAAGQYVLCFEFSGSLNGTIIGFYKSRYKNGNNETRYLATSKFQPTYARRAFPCFDEPSYKSTFSVSLVHEEGQVALSNMPVQQIEPFPDSNLFITKFEKSVPMVTYLACFIVSDFQFNGTTTSSGKPFHVYTTPDQVHLTAYALKFGSRVLDYFEKYFGIDYPLPKQDMVAIPDFASGAMEHWGVITFRETNLLYDPLNSSPQNLQRISAVIAHEMAHMWFGNLVTMEWWDDLWLNEGFASYVEYKGVDEQHPEWDTMSQFVTEELQPVMNIDSTMSSHPIVQPVDHPDEITEIFDDISYGKGASVLRMLEFFVGKDNFRTGISNFLKKYQYRNAKTADLWRELSKACGHPGNQTISSIMKTWTEQMGFPYINVVRSGQNSSSYVAKQKRFLKNEALQNNQTSHEYIWTVPLSYVTGKGETGIVWLQDEKDKSFAVNTDHSDWVKFNVNQTGFYLVNYEREEWDRFIHLLTTNHTALTPSDRSNLLFDSFLLAEGGHIGFDVFFSMSQYLKNETHLIPWATAYASFVYLCQLLEATEVNVLLKSYIRDLTNDLYQNLGWKTSDNHLDNLLRTTIIGLACHSGNEECLSYASELFQNWTQGQEVPSTLRSMVYNFGMAEIGREEHWNFMWSRYQAEESPAQKKALMNGLAHVRKPELILRYLEYAMDGERVRSQDFFTILSYISGNPIGRPLVWNFVREKWPLLVERFTLNNRYLGNAVKKICGYFTTESELEEMVAFFTKYPDAGAGKRRRQQALEVVNNNIKWIGTYSRGVRTWLETEGPAPWHHYRLPAYQIPLHYDLQLHPMLEADLFSGNVTIEVQLTRPSGCLVLHAVGLRLPSVKLTSDAGLDIEIEEDFLHQEHDYFVIKTREKMAPGLYRLYIRFEGELGMSLKGLYKSSYVDPGTNERRYLAVTQFAAVDARRAFPCFDEPSFKSTFNVSVIHNSTHFALSNSAVESVSKLQNDLLLTKFEKTLPMVTYLLSVVVSDFNFKENITENGVKLRVYSAPHLVEKTYYALDIASRVLTFYESYFGIPFPLKKLDLIAVPDMFFSAMENWGAITFSEERLIAENSSSIATRLAISRVIAHEVAHMWFGNLVTMKWWSDVWLNEGFATYIAQKGLKIVEPLIDKDNDNGVKQLITAMQSDQSVHSHAIVQPVVKVTSQIYDDIQYLKGSSMLRMLEGYIQQDFSPGVSSYLKRFSFKNARTEDLWDAFTSTSKEGLNVSLLMDTWTHQMNYPYITVERSGDQVLIQQHRFLKDPISKVLDTQRSPYNYIWQVPLTYRTSESEEVSYALLNSSAKINIPMQKHSWMKFNIDFSGFYTVNYDQNDWKVFINLLETNHSILSPSDRVNLLFDAFSLASAGYLDYDVPLNLTGYLKKEEHHGTWRTVLGELIRIKWFFKSDREVREMIKEFIRNLSKDLLKKYGWRDSGDYSERELRKYVIKAACENGNQDCLETAAYLFKQWISGGNLSEDIKPMVYEYGARVYSGEETWNIMWQRHLTENNPYEKQILRNALTTFRNNTLLERLIKYAKNETLVRKQHYLDMLERIALNPKGFSLVTHLIYNTWPQLVKTYGLPESDAFVTKVFKGYSTEKDMDKIRDFYRKYPAQKSGSKSRSQALLNLRANIHWIRNHYSEVRGWFRKNIYMPWKDSRLPRHIIPIRYNVTLRPDILGHTFEGDEEVEIKVQNDTDYLIVHEAGLRVRHTRLRNKTSGEDVAIEEELSYKRNEFHVIRLKFPIPKGTYVLEMEFQGKFSPDGYGIKKYQYQHRDTGETRYLLATRFEATYARKVFPCFDEPAMKARFKLAIVHSSNHSAVSNMPVEESTPMENSLTKTVFQESVKMSTYLVFFMVSDFEYLEADYKGKPVRAYAPPDRLHEAEHGLNLTVRLLEKFEEYFDVQYVLPKLDSVAIPNYPVPGMEHWGAISYNTNRFLVNEGITEYNRIIKVDRVIAHEIVHQWFGNLVTMKWWNDLWLNEGMSTMIMYLPLKQYQPSIEEVDVRKVTRMMCQDSSSDSHPIVRDANTPEEIEEAFDIISYNKGGAVMKMLQRILKDDFRLGLSNFLKKYAYSNAETKDLWEELTNASSMAFDVSSMMDTWTRQMGFPYVELKRDGSTLTATQHWFSRDMNESYAALVANDLRYSEFGFVWKIPLVYKNVATGNERTLWLNEKSATFKINAMKEDVVKFNPGFGGFYVVKYDTDDWERLGHKLITDHESFGVTDRYNLLHDAFVLAETGRLTYDVPFELTKYLKNEKEALPWNLFRDHFLHLLRRLDGGSEAIRMLKAYVRNLTASLYDEFVVAAKDRSIFKKRAAEVGSCSYTYIDLEFIPTIVDLACLSANEKCLASVNEDLQMWLLGHNVTSDLHLVMDLAVAAMGNDSLWDYISDEVVASETDDQRRLLLAEGLSSFTQPTLISKTIDLMAFHPKVDVSLARFLFKRLGENPDAVQYLWNYTRNHWDALMFKLDYKNNPSSGISIFCDKLKTERYLEEVTELKNSRPEIGPFVGDRCTEAIRKSIQWLDKYEETLTTWLTWNANL